MTIIPLKFMNTHMSVTTSLTVKLVGQEIFVSNIVGTLHVPTTSSVIVTNHHVMNCVIGVSMTYTMQNIVHINLDSIMKFKDTF